MKVQEVGSEVAVLGADRSGWRRVKFGDVVICTNENSRDPLKNGFERYVGLEHLDPEDLQIQRWGSVAEGTTFTRIFRSGQVLFGKRRAYQRKAAVADFDGICSGDILVFEAKPERLLPKLLPFIVQSDGFFDKALGTSAGSLSPRTKWSELAQYEFTLPPLDEQRRIVEVLWAVEDAYRVWQQAAEQIKQSIYVHLSMIGKGLDEAGAVKRSYSLCDVLLHASDGPFGSKMKTEHYTDNGARVVRLQNIEWNFFDDADKAFISEKYWQELKRYALYGNDVLVAGLGDASHPVGRACLFPISLEPAVHKADCFCLRPDTTVILPEYLVHLLNSPEGRNKILSKAQGTTRLRINLQNLKSIKLLLPSIEEQSDLCKTINSFKECLQQVKLQTGRVRLVRKAFVRSMFPEVASGDQHVQ